jgi:hypothetical protein
MRLHETLRFLIELDIANSNSPALLFPKKDDNPTALSQLRGHRQKRLIYPQVQWELRPKLLFMPAVVHSLDSLSRIETRSTRSALNSDWKRLDITYLRSTVRDNQEKPMLAIRLYLSALTLIFLFSTALDRGVGLLEAIVVICALVYLILDTREHLRKSRAELRELKRLEKKLTVLLQ